MDSAKEEIAVVGESFVVAGFRLAGVDRTFIVSESAESCRKINELLEDQTLGIIITTEKIVEECDRKTKQRIEAAAKPIVITVPGMEGPLEQSESISKLIKRALGIELKVQ